MVDCGARPTADLINRLRLMVNMGLGALLFEFALTSLAIELVWMCCHVHSAHGVHYVQLINKRAAKPYASFPEQYERR